MHNPSSNGAYYKSRHKRFVPTPIYIYTHLCLGGFHFLVLLLETGLQLLDLLGLGQLHQLLHDILLQFMLLSVSPQVSFIQIKFLSVNPGFLHANKVSCHANDVPSSKTRIFLLQFN